MSACSSIGFLRNGERGAAVLEFAMVGTFFLFLLIAVLDFGVAMKRRSALSYATNTVARRLAATHGLTCAELGSTRINETMGQAAAKYGTTFNPGTAAASINEGMLAVSAEAPLCALCQAILSTRAVRVETRIPLEPGKMESGC